MAPKRSRAVAPINTRNPTSTNGVNSGTTNVSSTGENSRRTSRSAITITLIAPVNQEPTVTPNQEEPVVTIDNVLNEPPAKKTKWEKAYDPLQVELNTMKQELTILKSQPQTSGTMTTFRPRCLKIDKFNGETVEEFEFWVEDLELLLQIEKHTEEQKLALFINHLSGKARLTFQGLSNVERSSISMAKERLSEIYSFRSIYDWCDILNKTKLNHNEELPVYAAKISRLVMKGYPSLTEEALEDIQIEFFLRGLPLEQTHQVRVRRPSTLREATELARIHEPESNRRKRDTKLLNMDVVEPETMPKRHGGVQEVNLTTILQGINNANKSQCQKFDDLAKQLNKNRSFSNEGQRPDSSQAYSPNFRTNNFNEIGNKMRKCWNCNSPGHFRRDCHKPRRFNTNWDGRSSQTPNQAVHHHHHAFQPTLNKPKETDSTVNTKPSTSLNC